MKARTLAIVIAALLIVPLVLFACVSPESTPTPAPLPTQAPTQAPAPTESAKAKPTTAAGASGGVWESVSCDTFKIGPEVAAVADCGYVTVPENRMSKSDRKIKLAVVRVKSSGKTPGAPLVLGTGGPGGGGLGNVQGAQAPGSSQPTVPF